MQGVDTPSSYDALWQDKKFELGTTFQSPASSLGYRAEKQSKSKQYEVVCGNAHLCFSVIYVRQKH